MAALLLFTLIIKIATEVDRYQHKRDKHVDYGDHLKVRHDYHLLSFREASEVKSQAPSNSVLPRACNRLVFYYSTLRCISQFMDFAAELSK